MANKANSTPTTTAPATPSDDVPNQAAPKKKRKPGVKYTKIMPSEYALVEGKQPTNPLDQLAEAVKGGLKFPGVIFEKTIMGVCVKIPARAAAIQAPTIRQLVKVLDELYQA